MNIGIIGNGFVGSSVAFGFSPQCGCDGAVVKIYDKDESKSLHSLEEVVNNSDYIFLSVPTPSNSDGSISLDIIYNVFEEIHNVIDYEKDNQPVILLRSTVTPGTTAKIQVKYTKMNIVFNPEFLTERSAKFDFINQSRFIVGGNWGNTGDVERLYKWRFGESTSVIKTNYETAELIKYMNNCFFATKVSFLNEMYQIADKCGANWDEAVEGFVRDGRIGHSHMNVPGPDGKFGFGGSCFPKDIQAMINFAKSLDINPSVLQGTWEKNLDVRPEEDWKKLKGRAVVDDEYDEYSQTHTVNRDDDIIDRSVEPDKYGPEYPAEFTQEDIDIFEKEDMEWAEKVVDAKKDRKDAVKAEKETSEQRIKKA